MGNDSTSNSPFKYRSAGYKINMDRLAVSQNTSYTKRKALDDSNASALIINSSSFIASKANDSKYMRTSEIEKLGSFNNSKQFCEYLRRTPIKTPSKSPARIGSGSLTPKRKTPRTPGGADRFIPSRKGTDMETGKFLMLHYDLSGGKHTGTESPSQRDYRIRMTERLHGCDIEQIEKKKVMSYKHKALTAQEGSLNNFKGILSEEKLHGYNSPSKKTVRHIPQVPEKILDAPDIINDYYLNPLDWSSNNQLAVALANHVYLWNSGSGEIEQLLELDGVEDYVSSVSWINEGNILAVGDSRGDVHLWDVSQMKKVRTMTGHNDRVTCLAWNEVILNTF